MLVLCLYECFNHFHGGRILYLCSCTKSNAVPHRLVLNVVYSAKSMF